ncbi:hypothetical protein [Acidisarcina polymorpha]|uniref:hypothetical protein n=1 Tax=Acidisarcina polymorpha TaxID=2211140 RepID=UPI001237AA02|nr:hypothetical protein [Acidisarcina polymorpha]
MPVLNDIAGRVLGGDSRIAQGLLGMDDESDAVGRNAPLGLEVRADELVQFSTFGKVGCDDDGTVRPLGVGEGDRRDAMVGIGILVGSGRRSGLFRLGRVLAEIDCGGLADFRREARPQRFGVVGINAGVL